VTAAGHSCRVVRIRTVPDLDSLQWHSNPDLEGSGEVSAMCWAPRSGHGTRGSFAGPPPVPESRPGHRVRGRRNSSAHRGVRTRGQPSDRRVTRARATRRPPPRSTATCPDRYLSRLRCRSSSVCGTATNGRYRGLLRPAHGSRRPRAVPGRSRLARLIRAR